jgi:NhaP-type Na+/H+ or K+/H+ antiporter
MRGWQSYLGFYLAEGTILGVSGVLAVVTMGILMAGYGKTAISTEEGQQMLHVVWQMIVFCAETVIFVLAGAIIIEKGFLRLGGLFNIEDWGYLFLLYVLLAVIRGVMVLLCAPYFRAFGYNLKPRAKTAKEFMKCMLIMTWGGLRGAVGLMMALDVHQNEELRTCVSDKYYNERVLLHTAGMVVLTTVVNAAMTEWVMSLLGMSEPNETEKQMFRSAIHFLEDKHDDLLISLQNHLLYPSVHSNAAAQLNAV